MGTKRGDGFQKTPETLRKAILAMQRKITRHKQEFLSAPLSIEVQMGDGRYVDRANPIVQEYRALVRDYSAAMKAYKEITDQQAPAEVNRLEDIRARFKVAK